MSNYQQGFFEGLLISLQAAKQCTDKAQLINYLESVKGKVEGSILQHIQKQIPV